MHSKWHTILCGTLFFCWKLSEIDFNAFTMACHPLYDDMSSYLGFFLAGNCLKQILWIQSGMPSYVELYFLLEIV